MLRTRVPLESFKRRRPNSLYLVLISLAILIIPFLPRNLMHSSKVGQSEIQRYELLCNIRLVYRTKNLDQSITQKKASNEALKNCLVYQLSTIIIVKYSYSIWIAILKPEHICTFLVFKSYFQHNLYFCSGWWLCSRGEQMLVCIKSCFRFTAYMILFMQVIDTLHTGMYVLAQY